MTVQTPAVRPTKIVEIRQKTLLLSEPVDLVVCKRQRLTAVTEANVRFIKLPPKEIGHLYLDAQGQAATPDLSAPEFATLRRHFGSVGGTWRTITAS